MILKKICFMLLLFCGIVSSAANLVKNGDFSSVNAEGKPEGWGTQSWGPPLGDFILDTQNFAGKAPSLRIDNKKADFHSFLAQWVELESGTTYRISYFIKGENIKAKGTHDGGVVYLMDKGNPLFSMGTGLYRHAQGSFGWRRVEHTFRTQRLQSRSLALLLALRAATGSIWFDDIQIKKVKEKPDVSLSTRLYPVDYQKDSFFLCKDFPAALLLNINLDRKVIPGNFLQMELDLPEIVEYLAS